MPKCAAFGWSGNAATLGNAPGVASELALLLRLVRASSRESGKLSDIPMAKKAAQLDREIAQALSRSPHARHATRSGPKLTENQKTMLRMAHDTGRMSSGRYGWNEMHVRSLEKKGLVRLVSKATWDKDWKLTDLGRETAKALHDDWLAAHAK